MKINNIKFNENDYKKCELGGFFQRAAEYLPPDILFPAGRIAKRIFEPCQQGAVNYFKFRRFLRESQWWQRQRLEEFQLLQLKGLMKYVYEYVPYYNKLFKKRGLRPADFNSIADLQKLPILRRETILKNFRELISVEAKNSSLYFVRTSGSSGIPLTLARDKRKLYMSNAFNEACFDIAGLNSNAKFVQVRGRPFYLFHPRREFIYEPYHNKLVLSSLPQRPEIFAKYIKMIRDFAPAYIMAPPSFMYAFALYCRDNSVDTLKLKSCVSYMENLYDFQREVVTERFDCEIFDFYRFSEKLINATECRKHQGLHVDVRQGVVEIADEQGRQVDDEQRGRMLCTGFDNLAMPLIRYDVKDHAQGFGAQCACGRGLPLLRGVDGRSSEIMVFNDKYIYPTLLSGIMRCYGAIKECQFIQKTKNTLMINMVVYEGFEVENDLKRNLRPIVGEEVTILVNRVESISRTRAGKVQFVKNETKKKGVTPN